MDIEREKQLKLVDLFAGIGGLSLPFLNSNCS